MPTTKSCREKRPPSPRQNADLMTIPHSTVFTKSTSVFPQLPSKRRFNKFVKSPPFERFYKTDKSRGIDKTGVGLGLYIARTIIEAHRQKIWVESEYNKWCKFSFTLPLAQNKSVGIRERLRGDTINDN